MISLGFRFLIRKMGIIISFSDSYVRITRCIKIHAAPRLGHSKWPVSMHNDGDNGKNHVILFLQVLPSRVTRPLSSL